MDKRSAYPRILAPTFRTRRRRDPEPWDRTRALTALGHTVKIMPAQLFKPYVKRGKNDAAVLCEAMSRPTMRFVPAKSGANQAGLMLMAVRERLVRAGKQTTNAIRGHAAEFGLIAPNGLDKIDM